MPEVDAARGDADRALPATHPLYPPNPIRVAQAMPMPRYPPDFIYLGPTRVRGVPADHWREDLGEETVEYFEATETRTPLRLTTEAIEGTDHVRKTTPLMTYDFYHFDPSPPPEDAFKMKASTTSPVFASSSSLEVGAIIIIVWRDLLLYYDEYL